MKDYQEKVDYLYSLQKGCCASCKNKFIAGQKREE